MAIWVGLRLLEDRFFLMLRCSVDVQLHFSLDYAQCETSCISRCSDFQKLGPRKVFLVEAAKCSVPAQCRRSRVVDASAGTLPSPFIPYSTTRSICSSMVMTDSRKLHLLTCCWLHWHRHLLYPKRGDRLLFGHLEGRRRCCCQIVCVSIDNTGCFWSNSMLSLVFIESCQELQTSDTDVDSSSPINAPHNGASVLHW